MGPIKRVTESTLDVLDVLLAAQVPLWGLAIAKEIGRTPASVYPILSRLEDGQWLIGVWEADEQRAGPRRRLVQLTNDGRLRAAELVQSRRVRSASSATSAKLRLA